MLIGVLKWVTCHLLKEESWVVHGIDITAILLQVVHECLFEFVLYTFCFVCVCIVNWFVSTKTRILIGSSYIEVWSKSLARGGGVGYFLWFSSISILFA